MESAAKEIGSYRDLKWELVYIKKKSPSLQPTFSYHDIATTE